MDRRWKVLLGLSDSLGSMVGPPVVKLEGAVGIAYKISGVQNVLELIVSLLVGRLRGS